MEDTICAISTALGGGGISIIRVSGSEAIQIVKKIFSGKDLSAVPSHTIHYGHIFFDGEIIDEVLVAVMRSPKTYTTEDVVEINLHGGVATTNRVLEILILSGCRLAEPGEFTKRAFLNGRIDLIESEAVSDIINAESEQARSLSVNQLTGKLSQIIRKLRDDLLDLEASIEVNIDYPEYEDLEDMTNDKVTRVLKEKLSQVEEMIKEAKTGKIIKNGINVAILGRPNVGKSSILNALLGEEKAIVTNIEGTTRDIVEGSMILNGVKVNFIDTAGIRQTEDVVEQIGVMRAEAQIDTADLIVLVLSNDEPLNDKDKELIKKIKDKKHIIFVNKNDLEAKCDVEMDEFVVYGNTRLVEGMDGLKDKISNLFELDNLGGKDFTYISNARVLALVKRCAGHIKSALEGLEMGVEVDVISIDLRDARTCLSECLGEVYNDELIDELFKNFCLGK